MDDNYKIVLLGSIGNIDLSILVPFGANAPLGPA